MKAEVPRLLCVGALLLSILSCSQPTPQQQTGTGPKPYTPPAHSYKIDDEDGQWQMPAKNYASNRFSGLSEINTGNVKNLKVAWTFSTGAVRGHEAAPLVVNNTMYVVTPFPNIVYALDLTKNGAVKWKYEPKPEPFSQGVACCDVVNRGAAYSNGRIFFKTLDNHFQARYANPSVTLGVQARAGGEQFDDDQNRFSLGRYFTIDAFASRPLARNFDVFIAAENLLNQRYLIGRTPVTTIGPPILVRAGIRFRLRG